MVTYKRKKYAHIWPIDPDTATPPKDWRGWPDRKKFALIISHDVDSQKGHDKCYPLMRLEERLGFRSSFNIVPEKYLVSTTLINDIKNRGFEVCTHGLNHDGKLFFSREIFNHRAKRINHYLQKWGSTGFTSPSMLCILDWMHALNISHSTSTFDTDPFEPQQNPVKTIFPFWVPNTSQSLRPSGDVQFCSRPRKTKILTTPVRSAGPTPVPSAGATGQAGQADIHKVFRGLKVESDAVIEQKGISPEGLTGFVELPYTLPQDFTLFVLMKEQTIHIWKKKLDWIARNGGMALFNSHPDYMNFNEQKNGPEEYSVTYYKEFLKYIKNRYKDQYWHVLPKQMARFWQQNYRQD